MSIATFALCRRSQFGKATTASPSCREVACYLQRTESSTAGFVKTSDALFTRYLIPCYFSKRYLPTLICLLWRIINHLVIVCAISLVTGLFQFCFIWPFASLKISLKFPFSEATMLHVDICCSCWFFFVRYFIFLITLH